jgi:putative ABC transport system permease protein
MRHLQIGENARMALTTIREHKVRSILTVLGVVIGVTAVIAVSSILVGLDRDVREFLSDFGTDTLFVTKISPGIRFGRLSSEERNRKPISFEDALAIRDSCPAVKLMNVELYPRFGGGGLNRGLSARYRDREVFTIDHSGSLPEYESVLHATLIKGRFFNDTDDLHRLDVIVIGYDLAEGLFPTEEPIGKNILVDGVNYEVIGVMGKRKGQFFRDEAADKAAVVPYRTHKKHHPQYDEHFIEVEAYPGMKAIAEDQIRGLLRQRRHVPYDKPDNFGISGTEQIATQFRQMTAVIALVTVVVSSIGLLVGGVGVMNIMLMSVTERTREIGVRKAMGARHRDITRQFLTEAITLTGGGGIIGVLLGIAISLAINQFLPKLPSVVPIWAIAAGVLISMSVGLFFGIYPAVKAARLDPVDALRYE